MLRCGANNADSTIEVVAFLRRKKNIQRATPPDYYPTLALAYCPSLVRVLHAGFYSPYMEYFGIL